MGKGLEEEKEDEEDDDEEEEEDDDDEEEEEVGLQQGIGEKLERLDARSRPSLIDRPRTLDS